MASRLIILLLLISISGCYTPIDRIENIPIEQILRENLTPEAYEAIKDIPIVVGHTMGNNLAAGTNFWSDLASFFIGCGIGRKIILSKESSLNDFGVENLLHEVIHQLHDLTLDGEGSWIDEAEFREAYEKCSHFTTFNEQIIIYTENFADVWITNIFGINDISENIAYCGVRCLRLLFCPNFLGKVYRKIFSKFSDY